MVLPSPSAREAFLSGARRSLLAWYRRHRRDLPWRRTRDPYRIWVSEVMLQQTQVATVIPYYGRFLKRFPSLRSLARAPGERVLAAWSGLGYYRRARHLHAAAQEVMRRFAGVIPADPAALRSLPGVGRYTAGALASIAFGLPEPAMDGNALRVLCRLLARRGNPQSPAALRVLEPAARSLLSGSRPGDVTQALMELGALVCIPASPRCPLCPLRGVCRAFASGLQSVLPEGVPGRPTRKLEAAVGVVRRGRSFLIVRRTGEGLMQDLWEFPGGILKPGEDARDGLARIGKERLGRPLRPKEKVASFRQTLTYRRLSVEAYRATLSEPLPAAVAAAGGIRWVRPVELLRLPHGSATRRILAKLAAGRAAPGASR